MLCALSFTYVCVNVIVELGGSKISLVISVSAILVHKQGFSAFNCWGEFFLCDQKSLTHLKLNYRYEG